MAASYRGKGLAELERIRAAVAVHEYDNDFRDRMTARKELEKIDKAIANARKAGRNPGRNQMARTVRLSRNPHAGGLAYGEWIPTHAVKFNEDGTACIMTEGSVANRGRRRRRNVAAGFYDEEGIFHPIRASYDYSRSRAGEKAKRRATPKRRKKVTAKRRRR